MLALREGPSGATLVSDRVPLDATRVPDRVLVDAARGGDVDAFAGLVRRHGAAAYRVAFRLLGSDADAQDAVQDAFVQAWRSLARFRGESSVSTWLYRIVTNRCLNLIAARRPTGAVDAALASPAGQPPELVESRERFAAVVAGVSALPGDQRAALVLRDFEGLSYEEIGQVLGVSVAAVKGRLHRARLSVLTETAAWR